jgi:hypothetical protein
VIGTAPRRSGKWRRPKSKRKLQRDSKPSARWRNKHSRQNDPSNGESADKLLLSALNYWEVKRDLIEERMAAIRSVTAAS